MCFPDLILNGSLILVTLQVYTKFNKEKERKPALVLLCIQHHFSDFYIYISDLI